MTGDNSCIVFDDVVAGYKDFMILNNLSFKVRKGKVGGFREYLSEDDVAYVDAQIAALGAAGCDWYRKAT